MAKELIRSGSDGPQSRQRKCACGRHASSATCEACSKKGIEGGSVQRNPLQRKASESHSPGFAPSIVHDVLHSPGQPLDSTTQTFFQQRLGHDFSQVHVHSDARAAESASAVNALAYTVGREVVFGEEQYRPDSAFGRGLLAHELVHTLQQRYASFDSRDLHIDSAHNSFERQAEWLSARAMSNSSASQTGLQSVSQGTLQRQPDESGLDGDGGGGAATQFERPITRACDAWEYNPADFGREIARQYVQEEFPFYTKVEISSASCNEDGCVVYFDSPADFVVGVSLYNKPVYVSANRIAPGNGPYCDYSYRCQRPNNLINRPGKLILSKLRCAQPGSERTDEAS
jgi:hypothetical protein